MKIRISVILAFVTMLSLILIGVVKEAKQDFKHPADSVLVITKYGGDNKQVFFDQLEIISKNNGTTIYRDIVSADGQEKTVQFGQSHNNHKKLATTSPLGSYVVNHGDRQFYQELKGIKEITFKSVNIDLKEMIKSIYLFGTRALSLWMIFVTFLLTIFAIEMRLAKRAMIHRQFGLLSRYISKNSGIYVLSVLLGGIGSILVYFLYNQGKGGAYLQAFGVLLSFSMVIMIAMVIVAQLLVLVSIRSTDIASILKNRYLNKVSSGVLLVGIFVLVFGLIQVTQTTLASLQSLQVFEKELKNWQKLDGYVRAQYTEDDSQFSSSTPNISDEEIDKLRAAFLNNQRNVLRYDQKATDDLVLVSPSTFDLENEQAYRDSEADYLLRYETDARLAKKMYYVSSQLIKLQQEIYPEQKYPNKTDNQIMTIYLPEKYKKQEQLVKNNVLAEIFNYKEIPVDERNIEIIYLANNQKTFVFNEDSIYDYHNNPSAVTDAILVQINYRLIDPNWNISAIGYQAIGAPFYNGWVKHDQLLNALKNNLLAKYLSSETQVSQVARENRLQVLNQIQGITLSLIATLAITAYIIYAYIKNKYLTYGQKLSVNYLVTGSTWRVELGLCLPIMITVLGSIILGTLATDNWQNFVFVVTGYLIEMVAVILISRYYILRRRLDLIKNALN